MMGNQIWSEAPERFRNDFAPFSNALQEYYVDIFRRRSQQRQERLAGIRTREQAETYIRDIRRAIRSRFRFPAEAAPLNAQTMYRRDMGDHITEGIVFFSRPGVAVSAFFMLPKSAGPHPAVLFLCGHSMEGRASYYRGVTSDLARQGFAVLSLDPMGQGERHETACNTTDEHNIFGRHLALSGEQFGAWRVYDAIRGIDYLATRPEADMSILGVTGCSGGCTLTSMVMALDDRPTMAAGSCAITSFLHNIENELPCDIEQLPQSLGTVEMEMADFLIAAAPRPILLLGQDNDFFDPRGTADAAADLRKFYTLLDRPGDAACIFDNLWHNFSWVHRYEMMKFFGKYAGLPPVPLEKLDLAQWPLEDFYCAPQGRVTRLPGCRSQTELALEQARAAALRRQALPEAELRQKIRELLAVEDPGIPYYRVLRQEDHKTPDGPRKLGRFGLETEAGRVMCVLKQTGIPDRDCFRLAENQQVLLYVGHLDSRAELERAPVAAGNAVLCMLDVRGIGEMTPGGCDRPENRDHFHPYQFEYHYASLEEFLGQSMLGKRVKDVLAAAALLESRGCRVSLYGRGQGAFAALFAAFVRPMPVTLEGLPENYLAYLAAPDDSLPRSVLPFGILEWCDLEDLVKYTQAEIIR